MNVLFMLRALPLIMSLVEIFQLVFNRTLFTLANLNIFSVCLIMYEYTTSRINIVTIQPSEADVQIGINRKDGVCRLYVSSYLSA